MESRISRLALRSLAIVLLISSLLVSDLPLTTAEAPCPSRAGRQGGDFEDGFEDDSHGTLSGGATIRDGFVTLDNVYLTDDFNRTTVAPWEDTSNLTTDVVEMRNGNVIATIADLGGKARASHPVDLVDCRIEVKVMVDVEGFEGPFIEVRTDSNNGYTVDFWYGHGVQATDMALRILRGFPGESAHTVNYVPNNRYPMYRWFPMVAEFLRDGTINFWYDGQPIKAADCFLDGNITSISLGMRKGGACRFDDLVVRRTFFDGGFVSEEVDLPNGMVWDRLEQDSVATYPQLLRVDVLDGATLEPVPGYTGVGPMSVVGIDLVRHPTLRLRVWLATMDFSLPVLDMWSLSWVNGSRDWMDPFDDDGEVTLSGDAVVAEGRATTPNIVLDDRFHRLDMAPWDERSSRCDVRNGGLWTLSGGKAERELAPFTDFRLDTIVTMKKVEAAGPRVELVTKGSQRLVVGWDNSSEEYYATYTDDTTETLGRAAGQWGKGTAIYLSMSYEEGGLHVDFGDVDLDVTRSIPTPFDTVRLSSSLGGMTVWTNISIVTPQENGTIASLPFSPPRGKSWSSLEVMKRSSPSSSMTVSLLDGTTGLPLEGFSDIQDRTADLTDVFVSDHPSLQLRIDLTGKNWSVPYVDWCKVHWEALPDDIVQTEDFTDVELDEDAGRTLLFNLSDHFKARITPTDKLSFKTVQWSDPVNASKDWDGPSFYVSGLKQDWNGTVTFRFECYNQETSLRSEVVTITVRPVNDAPTVSRLPRFIAQEDHDTTFNISDYLDDVDTPLGNLTVSTDEKHCTVSGHDLIFNFPRGGVDEEVEVTVSDGELTTSATLVVNVTEWDDPPVVASIDPYTRPEDTQFTIPLGPFVRDEDTPLGSIVLECDHEAVVSIEGLDLTLLFELPWEEVHVHFTVSDGSSSAEGLLVLVITDVNDPPELTVASIFRFKEGEERTVTFQVWDEDDEEFEVVPGPIPEVSIEVREGHLVVRTVKGKVGEFTVGLTVTDPHGASDEASFIIVVSNVNDPPSSPQLLSPLNHSSFKEGEGVTFSYEVGDPDLTLGDVLWINFTSDVAGTFARLTSADPTEFTFSDLPPGRHVVTVTVSDGQYARETWYELTIEEDEPEPVTSSYVWIAIIIALVVIIVVAATLSTRGGPEVVAIAPDVEEEPGPEEPEADEGRDERVREVQHALMGRPGGLPTSLWGWDHTDLAEAIVDGPRRELEDGIVAVRINGNWYNADHGNEDTFLDEVELVEEE